MSSELQGDRKGSSMKILSWNVRGLGSRERRSIVKQVIRMQKATVVLIQESKINSGEDMVVKDIWGAAYVKWANLSSIGVPGGILVLLDSRKVCSKDLWVGEFSVSVLFEHLKITETA